LNQFNYPSGWTNNRLYLRTNQRFKKETHLQIGIIHPFFDIIGGAEQTTFALIDKLKTTDNITTLYTVEPPKITETGNFRFHIIKKNNFPNLWRYQRMKEVKKIFKESQENDLVLVMGGGLLLERTNTKVIVYCHSTFSEDNNFTKAKFSGMRGIYYKILQKNIRNSLSYMHDKNVMLVTNSEYTKKEVSRQFGKESHVIYPPVDIDRFLKFFDSDKQKNAITVSRYSQEKRLEDAIDIAKLSGVPYILAGNAKYDSQLKLFESIKSRSNNSNITLHCNLPHSEIERLFVSSKVYLHTSKETFGISVVEAMSAGCIPIVPNNSAHLETVPFEELRFNGKDEAAKKLQEAISGKYDNLREELKKHVQKFSTKSFQEKMLEYIEKD
jgi:glycosyltransferase involved in cell wall biosynthesis